MRNIVDLTLLYIFVVTILADKNLEEEHQSMAVAEYSDWDNAHADLYHLRKYCHKLLLNLYEEEKDVKNASTSFDIPITYVFIPQTHQPKVTMVFCDTGFTIRRFVKGPNNSVIVVGETERNPDESITYTLAQKLDEYINWEEVVFVTNSVKNQLCKVIYKNNTRLFHRIPKVGKLVIVKIPRDDDPNAFNRVLALQCKDKLNQFKTFIRDPSSDVVAIIEVESGVSI